MTKLKHLRIRCFFDICIAEDNIGRIVFELFNDICPRTCENFKALCTGERGMGKFTGKPLHYKNVVFHRVVRNFIIQSGDFSQGNGKGGESIYGGTFEDESFEFKHEKPYLLSMANRGKNTNGSQFFITLAPAPHLDGVHVVFGHVISGQEIVDQIANQAVDKNAKPLVPIRIVNCGELIPQIKSKESQKKDTRKVKSESEESYSSSQSESDSDSSDSESNSDNDSDSGRKKLNISHQKQTSPKKSSDVDESDKQNEFLPLPNAPKVYAIINPDEVPRVPPNRFLSRNVKPKEQIGESNTDDTTKKPINDRRSDDRRYFSKSYTYSRSGRKIKGRGFRRFRTPSPSSRRYRRSETPPHWKSEQAKLKPLKKVLSRPEDNNASGDENGEKHKDNSVDRREYRHDHRSDRFDRRRHERSRSRSRDRYRSRFRWRRSHSSSDSDSDSRERNKRKRSRSTSAENEKDKNRKDINAENGHSHTDVRHRDRDDINKRHYHQDSKSSRDQSHSPSKRDDHHSVEQQQSIVSTKGRQQLSDKFVKATDEEAAKLVSS